MIQPPKFRHVTRRVPGLHCKTRQAWLSHWLLSLKKIHKVWLWNVLIWNPLTDLLCWCRPTATQVDLFNMLMMPDMFFLHNSRLPENIPPTLTALFDHLKRSASTASLFYLEAINHYETDNLTLLHGVGMGWAYQHMCVVLDNHCWLKQSMLFHPLTLWLYKEEL